MSVSLSDLPSVTDQTRRDQWGRYQIFDEATGKLVGYTRVTTVAKALDNGGGLASWKASMTAVGMTLRKGLRYQWAVLTA